MNKPWTIWWDFNWSDDEIVGVIVENDHPQYGKTRLCVPIEEALDVNGKIDTWEKEVFYPLHDALKSGRISLSKWVQNPTMEI